MRKNIVIPILLSFMLPVFSQSKESPVQLEALYVGDFFTNYSGGLATGCTYLGKMDFGISLATEDIGLWKGGDFFTLIENTHGANPSADYIGDMQVASNIDNGDYTFLYELWYRQQFNQLGIKVGVLDLNTHCHVSDAGSLFINSSFGIMPSASLNMPVPIFPVPALAIQLDYKFTQQLTVIAGVWDGNPGNLRDNRYNIQWTLNNREGYLYTMEGEWDYAIQNETTLGKLKIGSLYHSGEFKYLSDSTLTKKSNMEFHLIADQVLINKPEGQKGKLDAFLQIGVLPDKDINSVPLYLGIGLNYTGLLYNNASDILGLAIAHARVNEIYSNQFFSKKTHETAIELTYAFPLIPQITLQPDIQYIINPGIDSGLDNALVSFLRIIIEH